MCFKKLTLYLEYYETLCVFLIFLGKQKSRLKEEEASLTISSKVLKTDEIISSSVQSEPWTVLAHKKPEKD